jgi:hypothetical protein
LGLDVGTSSGRILKRYQRSATNIPNVSGFAGCTAAALGSTPKLAPTFASSASGESPLKSATTRL